MTRTPLASRSAQEFAIARDRDPLERARALLGQSDPGVALAEVGFAQRLSAIEVNRTCIEQAVAHHIVADEVVRSEVR